MKPIRALFLLPGPTAPREAPPMNRFHYLARYFDADVLQPGWRADGRRLQSLGSPERAACPLIRFHYTGSAGLPGFVRVPWDTIFYLVTAWRLRRRGRRHDCIIAFGFFKTAFAGWLLARATGAKLIIEVAVRQDRIVELGRHRPGLLAPIEHRLSMSLAGFLLCRADRLRLMYPGQVDAFVRGRDVPASAFPDFVPVSRLRPRPDDGLVLFMGSPLHLKGADIAIAAFCAIADHFPRHRLRVVGHAPDSARFEALAGHHPRIAFADPLPYAQALELIAGASCLIAPSRTDAMPRIVIEAMAMGKPVIAAKVDGLAHYLRHGENALLFEPGDAGGLARQLHAVLAEPRLAGQLGERARCWALGNASESQYAERFRDLVAACLAPAALTHAAGPAQAPRPAEPPASRRK